MGWIRITGSSSGPTGWCGGHNPKLEKAIGLVVGELVKNPLRIPKRPPYPVKKE